MKIRRTASISTNFELFVNVVTQCLESLTIEEENREHVNKNFSMLNLIYKHHDYATSWNINEFEIIKEILFISFWRIIFDHGYEAQEWGNLLRGHLRKWFSVVKLHFMCLFHLIFSSSDVLSLCIFVISYNTRARIVEFIWKKKSIKPKSRKRLESEAAGNCITVMVKCMANRLTAITNFKYLQRLIRFEITEWKWRTLDLPSKQRERARRMSRLNY